jgi:hypothetical protein
VHLELLIQGGGDALDCLWLSSLLDVPSRQMRILRASNRRLEEALEEELSVLWPRIGMRHRTTISSL